MGRGPGHDSGHAGFAWGDYVAWLVATTGSLAAVADRLCAARGHKDDLGSVERALRRLRTRGTRDGGAWGARALAVFGLPDAIDRRVRWLGHYHSRFTDLPRPMCAELVRAWTRPPLTESRVGRAWLALAEASLALRGDDHDGALAALDRGRADLAAAPPEARLEALLARGYVASRREPAIVLALLAEAPALLALVSDADDRACLAARLADHRAYELNRAGDHAAAHACYAALPVDGPPFARARRASGLAYAAWKLGDRAAAIAGALAAADHAGDGGHVRARAMALALAARISGDDALHQRALAISRQLADETLLARLGAAP
ncbi:MAG: hypothetical protein K8W52_27990 [Deltaproteobacteria bacterium]|nr:hypothetical protein [Deltaproteobacteria bacterium]